MNQKKFLSIAKSKKTTFLLLWLNIFLFITLSLMASMTIASAASSIAERVKGRILLQVEQNGEAWYVNPTDLKRYFLGRPNDAFDIMRKLGLGITDKDIIEIEIGKFDTPVPAPKPIDYYTCASDSDCVAVKLDYCATKKTAINKNFLSQWNNQFKDELGCILVVSPHISRFSKPQCLNNKCGLIPDTELLCDRPNSVLLSGCQSDRDNGHDLNVVKDQNGISCHEVLALCAPESTE